MGEPGIDAFEKLVALLNYPMFVVTTQANGTTAGCVVGFACQERPASVIACAREFSLQSRLSARR